MPTAKSAARKPTIPLDNGYMLQPEDRPRYDHLITEDDTPVDSWFAEKQHRLLVEPLYSSWSGPPGEDQRFLAVTNVGLFNTDLERLPPVVPDMMLSLRVRAPVGDRRKKENRSYFIWRLGKPPDVAIEVVSNKEGDEDTRKLQHYADIQVPYYVIYDPDHHLSRQTLRVFKLDGGTYVPLSEPFFIPLVGLGLKLWDGEYQDYKAVWLRWCDKNGKLIPTGAEKVTQENRRATREKRKALHEAQKVREEKQRADSAEERARRLAAKLRKLGVDPDGE